MTELFLNVLGMSISALWLIGAVLLLRLALKRSPKWIHVLLWALVAIRLVCPFSFESRLSLMPQDISSGTALEEWSDDYVGDTHFIHDANPGYQAAVNAGREPISAGEDGYYVVTGPDKVSEPETVKSTVLPRLVLVWVGGMAVLSAYAVCSYLALRRKMATAVLLKRNIYRSEAAPSPFVLGLFRPRIYLPFSMEASAIPHVLAHERSHIRRKDHWWKPLGFLVLTVHWFNPAVWLSYILLCRDIELACDERVIREMDAAQQAAYSQALLSCSIHRRSIAACPLAFGEVGVKRRVRNILNYKKPAFWVVLMALVLCVAVAVCFLTDPVTKKAQEEFNPAIQWFDYLETGSYPLASDDNQATIPHFPGVTFRADPGAVYAEKDGISTEIIQGMPVWNVYFSDLTGDGIYELCATVSEGSGIIDEHVVVYDYAAGTEYLLRDRGSHDYILRLEGQTLVCDKHVYPQKEIVENGKLMLVSAGGGDGVRLEIVPTEEKGGTDFVEFSGIDFSGVTAVKLDNAHNGKSTAISDPESIEAICAWLSDISGSNGRNSKGRHYQGTFALTLMAGDEQVFQIAFGDDDVFFYGKYDENYAIMYDLDRDIGDVIHFLYRYDESGFDWGIEETVAVEETTPYAITSTIPTDSLTGDIEYLQPGDIIGYGFLKEEMRDLGILLNDLMPKDFVEPQDFTPTMKVNLRWEGGRLTLYSDGRQTTFGEDRSWAVLTGELNKFLSRFSLGRMAGGEQLPLEELSPYYNSEQAMIDGCVVMRDGDVRSGQELIAAFYAEVSAGAPSSVRIASYYDDPSVIQVADISFDGETFTWRATESGAISEKHYQYLYHYTEKTEFPNAAFDAIDCYVLTNKKNVTWKQLWDGLLSSASGAYIDHVTICNDYIYYPSHPLIPNCEKITLEYDGALLLNADNIDALETLFSEAEETYEPKTWSPGPILRLTGKDGTEVIIELGLDTDWVRIDGIYYDFGPGFDEDGAYDALVYLFSLLGIRDWPQEVYDGLEARGSAPDSTDLLPEYDSLIAENFTAGYVLYPDGTSAQLKPEDIPAIQAALRGAEVSDGSDFPTDENGILEDGLDHKIALTRADGETMVLYCWEEDFTCLLDTGRMLYLVRNPSLQDTIATAVEHIQ